MHLQVPKSDLDLDTLYHKLMLHATALPPTAPTCC
jgi:hypothetical protein